jgi:hypothetical protein
MITAMRRARWILLLIALAPASASAQVPLEVFGGYSAARDPRDQVTLPAGWVAGVAVGLTPVVAVVGDVSGQYRTLSLVNAEVRLSTHTLMGGLRASARVGRLTEFGQIVAGAVRASASAFGATATGVSIAIQPGVGVDWPLTRRWAARAQIDVRFMGRQLDASNGGYQYRFATGLVYRVRSR